MKKICVVTGTRAEYGLLKPVIERVYKDTELELQLVVTGMHLSPEFGLTYQEIETDGYPITDKVEMLLSSDSNVGITKSMAVALMGFADSFERLRPDIVVILGDRYEMLMVASAAMIAKIPIAHIHGGEATEGAYDDSIRHAITKMSYLHFPSTEEYRRRIIQLGENPQNVFNVGSLGVENIKKIPLWEKERLENDINFRINEKTILVTYHPCTLEEESSEQLFENLLHALDSCAEIRVIFTKANADTDGRVINRMIDEYVTQNNERSICFTSMGQIRYLSAVKYCRCVVGNSSSGIIEVPSLHRPTVNIGDRQKGRIFAASVIHCDSNQMSIEQALDKAMSDTFQREISTSTNPYEGKDVSASIVATIKSALMSELKIKKTFYDIQY